MITINGQKMGKSLGNFITLNEFFSGKHALLERAYSPMTIRFFILQSHYRSTLDFSNEALLAAEKGYKRMMHAFSLIPTLPVSPDSTVDVAGLETRLAAALNDDLNTAVCLAELFEATGMVHQIAQKQQRISMQDKARLEATIRTYVQDVLGLVAEQGNTDARLDDVLKVLISLRQQARKDKNFALSDAIRDQLLACGIQLLDGPEGTQWRPTMES
jgi:cysteinyl-tRNA synthetase